MDEKPHFQPSHNPLRCTVRAHTKNVLITHTRGSSDLEHIMSQADIKVTHVPILEVAPIKIREDQTNSVLQCRHLDFFKPTQHHGKQ